MRTRLLAMVWALLLTAALVEAAKAQAPSTQVSSPVQTQQHTILTTTVRRVVLDVAVTDPKGSPVPGLTAADFAVTEDGEQQRILSFDANGFSPEMDYVPPTLPPEPANTFINLPTTPEKGPLYVLLYDLVNMESQDQMDSPEDHRGQMNARQQMVKFIQNKQDGTRFAIFIRSDGLHLIQGFTSDKSLLYSAIDPHSPKPHIPMIFLMGPNFGRGDRLSALHTLNSLASYLDGLPGRKNLIWYSSQFPLSLFASDSDGLNFQTETKATLNLLAHNQIAIYPVDARGVASQDSHNQLADSVHSDTITSPTESGGGSGTGSGSIGVGSSPSQTSTFVQGSSTVIGSYSTMDEIARETGGRAFYSDNDVAGQLVKATESGEVYYTLTYAPTNSSYDGKLRNIHVELAKKGYELAYRRSYYGTEEPTSASEAGVTTNANRGKPDTRQRPVEDTLCANMAHGAPTAHRLVFVVQAHTIGVPVEGTREEMAELATEPAYFKSRRKSAVVKLMSPIPLQKYVFNFDIATRQFEDESSLNIEIAAAVYDADGQMMNAFVRVAKKDLSGESGATDQPRFFRIDQELEVPLAATFVRLAVRDTTNDRVGAMEVKLPLAPEGEPHL
jgi:VWFA-related protein